MDLSKAFDMVSQEIHFKENNAILHYVRKLRGWLRYSHIKYREELNDPNTKQLVDHPQRIVRQHHGREQYNDTINENTIMLSRRVKILGVTFNLLYTRSTNIYNSKQ